MSPDPDEERVAKPSDCRNLSLVDKRFYRRTRSTASRVLVQAAVEDLLAYSLSVKAVDAALENPSPASFTHLEGSSGRAHLGLEIHCHLVAWEARQANSQFTSKGSHQA